MSLAVRFTRGIAWMTIGNWSEQALNLIVFVVLVRMLGAETFGLLTMAMAMVLIGEGLVRETISEFLFAARDQLETTATALFWALLLLGGALTGGLFLSAPLMSWLYAAPEVEPLLQALSPIVMLTAITAVPVGILRQRMQIRPLALRAFLGVALGGAVGIGLATLGFGLWALAAQRLVLTAVNVVMAWGAAGWRPGRWTGWSALRPHLPFASQMLVYRAAEMGTVQLPAVAIGMSLGPVALGYYTIAWRMVELASFLIVTPVRTAALPAFAHRSSGRAGLLFADTLRLTGFLAIPSFTGLAVTASEVMELFGGPHWAPAAPVMAILSAYGMLLCLTKIEDTFCLAYGRSRALAGIALANLVLLLILLAAFAQFGIAGMTAAVVLAAFAVVPARLVLVARLSGGTLYMFARQQAGPVVASAAMALCLLALGGVRDALPPVLSLLLSVGVGGIVYGGIAAWKMRLRLAMARGYLAGLRRGASDPEDLTPGVPR